jgi:radical SAM/Cys-rich protein
MQLQVLNTPVDADQQFPNFQDLLSANGYENLKPGKLDIIQINIGKLCNQTCAHCHVDAGPDRKNEQMSRENLEICLDTIRKYEVKTVDITGGAPEMNSHFRWFVEACSNLGCQVMDRCNLTIIRANPKYNDLPAFFAEHKVHIISSLPHFSKLRTDSQRGEGVFEDSIAALHLLNQAGYGRDQSLQLDLVYNPSGAFLPGGQNSLEGEFKRQLKRKYGIDFNRLYVITNLPISRFLEYLIDSGNYHSYMESLVNAFNPSTIDGLMCRNTISISWNGYLYDCDFNQMLDLKVDSACIHIRDFDLNKLAQRQIVLNQHCYGCTAGAGSSCGGEIV